MACSGIPENAIGRSDSPIAEFAMVVLGLGGCCSNKYGYGLNLNTIYQIGYNKGYVDASQNNGYNCEVEYHTLTYCKGYQAGYNASSSNGNEGNDNIVVSNKHEIVTAAANRTLT